MFAIAGTANLVSIGGSSPSMPNWFSSFSRAARILDALRGYYWFVVAIAMAVSAKAVRLIRHSGNSVQKNYRMPTDPVETRYWILNMRKFHRFSAKEIASATGLSESVSFLLAKRYLESENAATIANGSRGLFILPYPGGRHPRLGFQDGALLPQRETKVSIFAPWEPYSYVVADIPEAIFSDRGLLYLAHTHVPTVWDKNGIRLAPLEWRRHREGTLSIHRQLPDGVAFAVRVQAQARSVAFHFRVTNKSPQSLSRLRIQNCILLGRLAGFETRTNRNKIFRPPYVACRSMRENLWIIVASQPCYRVWANPLCPCIHSDATSPDCEPGESRAVTIRVWFYAGNDIDQQIRWLDQSGWREQAAGDFVPS
jgi:hypothetical protein